MSSMLPEVDKKTRTAINALTQELYKNKCARPSFEDILNCFYELQFCDFESLIHDLASLIHQIWNAKSVELGGSGTGGF